MVEILEDTLIPWRYLKYIPTVHVCSHYADDITLSVHSQYLCLFVSQDVEAAEKGPPV